MGSAGSKAARTAAGSAKRQFPTRIPQQPPTSKKPSPGPTVHPRPQASTTRNDGATSRVYTYKHCSPHPIAINADSIDPHLAASLRKIGPVQPSPTFSNTSTAHETAPQSTTQPIFPSPSSNPALKRLSARSKLTEQAETEFAGLGRSGFQGKSFLDVMIVRQILVMRDEKHMSATVIEKELGLKKGVVARLGPKGVVGEAGGSSGADRLDALG